MKLWGNCFLNSFLLQQFQYTVFHTFKCVQCEIICNSSLYFSLDLYKVQSLPFNWFVMYHLSTVTAAFEKPYFLYKQQFSYFQGSFQDILYSHNCHLIIAVLGDKMKVRWNITFLMTSVMVFYYVLVYVWIVVPSTDFWTSSHFCFEFECQIWNVSCLLLLSSCMRQY